MPPEPTVGSTATTSTITPIPPIHWVIARQNSTPGPVPSIGRSTVAPVVVNPEIDSNIASSNVGNPARQHVRQSTDQHQHHPRERDGDEHVEDPDLSRQDGQPPAHEADDRRPRHRATSSTTTSGPPRIRNRPRPSRDAEAGDRHRESDDVADQRLVRRPALGEIAGEAGHHASAHRRAPRTGRASSMRGPTPSEAIHGVNTVIGGHRASADGRANSTTLSPACSSVLPRTISLPPSARTTAPSRTERGRCRSRTTAPSAGAAGADHELVDLDVALEERRDR